MSTQTLDRAEDFDFKSIGGQIAIDEAEGVVECFAAGIGNKDSVGDIILPGAFAKSLKRRMPRVVWGHDWNHPIGKVLEVYEVPPSDPRLPMKMKAAGIGGLYAKVKFNLKSEKGREAFANLLFFGEDQEWSIGYKTLDHEYNGKAQANMLKEVELFEMSPVLHGANQLTSTISIKADESADDDVIKKGLAKLKSFADDNPDWASEVSAAGEKGYEHAGVAGKAGIPGSEPAVGRGDIAGGRGPRRGNLEDLLNYWRPIMKKPGGFRRCLVILADHPELGPLPNMCAWLHHETTGKWPNEGHGRGKSAEFVEQNANLVVGKIGMMAKSLAEHFGGVVMIHHSDSDSVVFDLVTEDGGTTLKTAYEQKDDDFLFGKGVKVKPKMIYKPVDDDHECDDDEDCGGECCSTKKTGETTGDILEKVGRAISSNNLNKLQEALKLLQEVITAGSPVMQVKDEVVIETMPPALKTAVDAVNAYHGSSAEQSSDGSIHIEVKSEKHRAALNKIVSAFSAQEESVES